MVSIFRAWADCRRFVFATETTSLTAWLVRIGMAWLVIAAVCHFLYLEGQSGEEKVIFHVLLLLLLAGSGIGRFSIGRQKLFIAFLWSFLAISAGMISSDLMQIKTDAIMPPLIAYLYALLSFAVLLLAIFTRLQLLLCQKCLTGKDSSRDIWDALKKKGLTQKPDMAFPAAVLIIVMYGWYQGLFEFWNGRLAFVSFLFLFSIAGSCVLLARYAGHLHSANPPANDH